MADLQTVTPLRPAGSARSLQVLNAPTLKQQAVRYEVPQPVSLWTVAGGVFVLLGVVLFLALRGTPAGSTLGLSFVSVVLEALPFVILGSLLGGVFEVFIPREWVLRVLPERKILGILVAASLGLLLPVCECAVIPFTRRLVRKGIPFSTAMAYMLAGPTVNVLTGWSTLIAYNWNWHILAARMGFGYFIAVGAALVVDRWFPGHTALLDPAMSAASSHDCGCGHDHDDHAHSHEHDASHDHDHHHEHDHDHGNHDHHHHHDHDHKPHKALIWGRLVEAINHAGDDFLQVSQFLILGAFVASICQTVVPRQAFLALAHAPVVAILLLMGLAVALNLCSGANAFVASSFRATMPLAAQMGFMLVGPMLDLKLSAMYLSFVRKKTFVALMILIYGLVLGSMVAWQCFFAAGVR
jgi:uncharacterized membrane protein YraQ (UPF0718 family)